KYVGGRSWTSKDRNAGKSGIIMMWVDRHGCRTHPFTVKTRVRFPLGTPADPCGRAVPAFSPGRLPVYAKMFHVKQCPTGAGGCGTCKTTPCIEKLFNDFNDRQRACGDNFRAP